MFNFKQIESFFKKKFNLNLKKEEVEEEKKQDNFFSLQEQAEKVRNNIQNKLILYILIIPISIMLLIVIIKTIGLLMNTKHRKTVNKNIENFDLKIDKDYKWKIRTDEQIVEIKKNIKEVSLNVKKELNKTKIEIDKNAKQLEERLGNKLDTSISEIKKIVTNSNSNLTKQIIHLKQKQDQLERKIKNIKPVVIKKYTNSNSKQIKSDVNLPKLPDLKPIKNKNLSGNTQKTKNINSSIPIEDELVEKDSEVVIDNINIDTLEKPQKKSQKQGISIPNFTLMPGFAKGVLVNGGEVPVSFNGNNEPIPIYIRLTGDELIPNDDSVTVDGCLILGVASGDFAKKAVNIRLSKLTCNLIDIDGNRYKVEAKVSGWVFGENAGYGIPGRLITREGEIIKTGLPLTFVETMIQSLGVIVQNKVQNTVSPQNTQQVLTNSLAQSATGTTTTILKKFSDYYLKMLDSLNPLVEIRAGRKVTVAFKGGEKLKVEKYNPLNTNYFMQESLEDEDY